MLAEVWAPKSRDRAARPSAGASFMATHHVRPARVACEPFGRMLPSRWARPSSRNGHRRTLRIDRRGARDQPWCRRSSLHPLIDLTQSNLGSSFAALGRGVVIDLIHSVVGCAMMQAISHLCLLAVAGPTLRRESAMRCYDCPREGGNDSEGIGVCSRCGLATCENHARIRQVHVSQVVGLGRSYGRHLARRLVCHTCDLAESTY
ncbi:DUF2180 family protein [Streptomyces sp. NPDC047049]|uniref:DUF2180 family protein n=1 Tax=Streptomyces sp. NPDC047049 TaxID=3156688 RepID=UPI0033D5E760